MPMIEIVRKRHMEQQYVNRIATLVRKGKPFRACLHESGFEVQLLPDWRPKLLHERTRRRLIRRGALIREDMFDGKDLRVIYERSW